MTDARLEIDDQCHFKGFQVDKGESESKEGIIPGTPRKNEASRSPLRHQQRNQDMTIRLIPFLRGCQLINDRKNSRHRFRVMTCCRDGRPICVVVEGGFVA